MDDSISLDPVTQPSTGSVQNNPADPTLSRGAKGDDVKELQRLLNRYGNTIAVDGDFGPKTEAAVIAFQKTNGLKEDGIVSDSVWTALRDLWLLTVALTSQSNVEDVKTVQERLKQIGFPLVVDGLYGTQTSKALRHYQALRHPVSVFDSKCLENLQDDKTLAYPNQNKKDSLAYIALIMLRDGYELAYVAGLLANSYHEGNVGQFESSSYTSNINNKPGYLKIMDELYDYGTLYSGKTIMKVSLSKVEELITKLAKDNWNKGKFGLGSIQWTGSRCQRLVEHYRNAADKSDTITESQAIEAEGEFILEELKDVKQEYISIYPDWRKANAANLNSGEAANKAAQALCRKYEKPANMEAMALKRGETAIKIYNIMSPPITIMGRIKKLIGF